MQVDNTVAFYSHHPLGTTRVFAEGRFSATIISKADNTIAATITSKVDNTIAYCVLMVIIWM